MNILIIGASGKIGYQLSKYLNKNHNLLLHFFSNKEKLDEFCNIPKFQGDIIKDFDYFLSKINEFQPNIIINCYSTYTENNFNNFEKDELINDLNSNALYPLLLYKEFAKIKSSKLIINFLDSKALMRDTEHYSYSLSKILMKQITLDSAYYLAPIRINAINLGLNESDNYTSSINLPLKRKVSFDEINSCVDFLIKNENITGEIINLDSGRHLRKG